MSRVARPRLVVASQNPGKAREIGRLFPDYEVLSLAGLAPVDFPEEGGDYAENARTKALVAARATGLPCVADDSGLEVEALGGAPGPYSARYGGPGLDDRGRYEALLGALRDVAPPRRARFVCHAAVATPDGRTALAEGACRGEILESAHGEGGFGYDPVFRPEGHQRSMAELSREEKDALSHRGRAFEALRREVAALLGRDG
ncbi:MAG TPA: RdgB/HAM1 family non-canonical purine NTP pyrophosphatase [Myxococcota bacterium]|nr:RdgB/HAM1 family non-canonical purine NTP pyrophosphatase [Myxococcota bacterium]